MAFSQNLHKTYNDRLFPGKYTVEDHISKTKLEKGDHTSKHGTRVFFPIKILF